MNISLKANIRKETGKKLKPLRKSGLIPGVVYGKGIDNVMVSVEVPFFDKVFKEARENKLIDLKIEGDKERTVLIQDVTRDVVKGGPLHIDFFQVRLDEKIRAEIPLVFIGESRAVKELNGTLLKQLNSVEVESLPGSIPQEIEVDISGLEEFSDHIMVSSLTVPSDAKIITSREEIIASVAPPRTEQEMEELKEEVVEEVEKVSGVTKETDDADKKESSDKEEVKKDEPQDKQK